MERRSESNAHGELRPRSHNAPSCRHRRRCLRLRPAYPFPGHRVTLITYRCMSLTSTNTLLNLRIGTPGANEYTTISIGLGFVPTTLRRRRSRIVPVHPSEKMLRSSGYGILGVRRHGGGCTFRRDDVAPWPTNRRLATMIISCRCNTCVFYGSPEATGQHIGLIMSAVWGVDGDSKYSSAERRMVWQ